MVTEKTQRRLKYLTDRTVGRLGTPPIERSSRVQPCVYRDCCICSILEPLQDLLKFICRGQNSREQLQSSCLTYNV